MKKDEYWLKDSNNIHSVCEKAIFTYGAEHQRIKAIEEVNELIEAINDFVTGQDHNVEEEMADVFIMICQLKKMFQVNVGVDLARPIEVTDLDYFLTIKYLSKLGQSISRQLIGDDHEVEKQITNVEIILHRIKQKFDTEKINQFIYKKLERFAGVVW